MYVGTMKLIDIFIDALIYYVTAPVSWTSVCSQKKHACMFMRGDKVLIYILINNLAPQRFIQALKMIK